MILRPSKKKAALAGGPFATAKNAPQWGYDFAKAFRPAYLNLSYHSVV